MRPELDEIERIWLLPAPKADMILQRRQRARHPEPCLDHDDPDHRQVDEPEPRITDPLRPHRNAGKDRKQADDDECHVCEVKDDDEIGHHASEAHGLVFFGGDRVKRHTLGYAKTPRTVGGTWRTWGHQTMIARLPEGSERLRPALATTALARLRLGPSAGALWRG